MKKDLIGACIAFLIFTFVNIAASTLSKYEEYEFSLIHVYFLVLYLLACSLKWKLRKTLRLPVFQLVMWLTLYTSAVIFKAETLVIYFYMIYELMLLFCTPFKMLMLDNLNPISEIYFMLLIIFMYKFLVLEAANFLGDILLKKVISREPKIHI